MSTVQDKDMWTIQVAIAPAAGSSIVHPQYTAVANRLVITEDLIIRQFFVIYAGISSWPSQVTSLRFKLVVDNTVVLDEQILQADADKTFIHIYDIGTTLNPIIVKKEQLIHLIITVPPTQGSQSPRMIYGAWGTWLRSAE